MWLRTELKQRGKTAFYRNYWIVVVVALIIGIASFGGESGGSTTVSKTEFMRKNNFTMQHNEYVNRNTILGDVQRGNPLNVAGSYLLSAIIGVLMLAVGIVVILLRIFVGNAILVGGRRFFMENREHTTKVQTVVYAFKSGRYMNITLTMFLRDLYTFLWTLLFIIPGIIKFYEYRMVPYLLAENPGMERKRAFEISRQMMHGQKLDVFVLDLSFLGWEIISLFTCGILSVFFVMPYECATEAELYTVLRTNALQVGMLTVHELPGFGVAY